MTTVYLVREPAPIWVPEAPDCSISQDKAAYDWMFRVTVTKAFVVPASMLVHSKPPGDPDGPLIPLPKKPEPVRVVPDFPLAAYQALVRG